MISEEGKGYQRISKHMKVCQRISKGYQRISKNMNGYPQITMDIYGSSCTSTDILGHPLASTDVHCPSITISDGSRQSNNYFCWKSFPTIIKRFPLLTIVPRFPLMLCSLCCDDHIPERPRGWRANWMVL